MRFGETFVWIARMIYGTALREGGQDLQGCWRIWRG
jgi:hypothetical protein